MFKWFKRKQAPQSPVQVVAPQPSTVIDLRLDKSTPKQDEALAAFMAWGNELVTRHKFRLSVETDNAFSYRISLVREEDTPVWLRYRIVAQLDVDEDERDRRHLGRYSSLFTDCILTDEDGEDETQASFEAPFAPSAIARGQKQVAALLAKEAALASRHR